MAKDNLSFSGVIDKVVFTAPNGFKILSVTPLGTKDKVTCVGNTELELHAGLTIVVSGKKEMSKYGEQLKFENLQVRIPENGSGMVVFLASGLFEGVREKKAKAIVDKFGDELPKIIEESPLELVKVRGITEEIALGIAATWKLHQGMKEIYEFLSNANVTTKTCQKIYEEYKEDAVKIINANAYILALDIDGFGFIKSDSIALGLGYRREDPRRIDAALNYVLMDNADRNGHLFMKEDELITESQKLLGYAQPDHIISRLNFLLSDKNDSKMELVYKEIAGDRCYYYSKYANLEEAVCNAINSLKGLKTDFVYDLALKETLAELQEEGITLSGEQILAVRGALENRIFVISGRPGTGKTTILKCITRTLAKMGRGFILTAPTGKASRRISESTSFPAQTIHKFVLSNKELWNFKYVPKRVTKTPDKTLVMDESSMIDLKLFNQILATSFDNAHFIFLGDARQLPPIGLGDIFRCMIEEESVQSAVLGRVFRQAEGSGILDFLTSIEEDKPWLPELKSVDDLEKDAVLINFREEIRQQKLIDLYMRYFREGKDVQILTPKREGQIGVETLNRIIQEKINPASPEKLEIPKGKVVFREGDKVMFTENNKELEVSNGDIGKITRIQHGDKKIKVSIVVNGDIVETDSLDSLEHAYAITIHKSQGSEYEIAILCILSEAYFMLNKNLLYTGASRAKKKLLLMGDYKSLKMCIAKGEASIRNSDIPNLLKVKEEAPKKKRKQA
jgi:exodeoxyribonuclease V alpha subunit